MSTLPQAVAALAGGDLDWFAARFAAQGLSSNQAGPGMLQINCGKDGAPAVLLSVGVHGDETGPLELLALLLEELSSGAPQLAADVLLVVGNVAAIAAGKRFIDADLNRMFKSARGDLEGSSEAARADQMMAATRAFFEGRSGARWHLDLHTAIRPSLYPAFAIVPELIQEQARSALWRFLSLGGIGAIIRNPQPSGTYSYFSSEHCGAAGSTLELGRVGVLGQNDLQQFDAMRAALADLLRGTLQLPAECSAHLYRLAQEIIKRSADFKMSFDKQTQNFSALPQGALIAEDGAHRYTVQHAEERVVFPNPDVRIGLRAGLMVVREV
ncbi:succinylglutamate desuccinylase [Massilia sp. W12]|uniref:succinylglutamate desuccinylase n=1 Tax=Massilia sp. W12 TaxID=3126507 RepID=UPI0030CE44CD